MLGTLLIVDDSYTTRRMIRRTVELAGLPMEGIDEAASGEEALERLGRGGVGLVLADLNMPGMGGQGLIKAMGDAAGLRDVPVIVISSEGNQQVLDSLHAMGVRHVLRKPFQPGILRGLLEPLFQPV
jgi:two-component system chemotaxis response regulator CheY